MAGGIFGGLKLPEVGDPWFNGLVGVAARLPLKTTSANNKFCLP